MPEIPSLEVALTRVGELLAADNAPVALVIIGGAALNLGGYVSRTTTDVDVIAMGTLSERGVPTDVISEPPARWPPALQRAIAIVARANGLLPEWLNAMSALHWRQPLPEGIATRVQWRTFGGALHIGIAARRDLIAFKVYAAADFPDAGSVHAKDLRALGPSDEELDSAAHWTKSLDPSPAFADSLDKVIAYAKQR